MSFEQGDQKQHEPQQITRSAIGEKYRSATWFIVVSVMMANFTDLFIYSAIVPVAPFALPTRAGIAPDNVQYWVSIMLAVFNVFSISASLPCGWISDKLGIRRPMFVIGTVIQFGGLALIMIGTNIPMWIAGRALQGVACAIVLTTTLPLLLESAPKKQEGRYLGLFGMSASAGLVTGPLIGGILYDRCGYYPVFVLCVVLNLVDAMMRMLIIEKKNGLNLESPAEEVVDVEKCTTIVDSPIKKTTSILTQVELSGSDTDSEFNLKKPSKDTISYMRNKSVVFELLCSKRMLAALYGGFLYTSIQTAFDATLTIFVEETFNWNSLGGGLIFVPLLMSDFCGPIFGWLGDRFGARLTCMIGFLIGITPLVCLRFVEHNTIEHKILLCALLATVGMGMAAVLPAVMTEIGAVIEEKGLTSSNTPGSVSAVARAYGLFNIAYSGGCMIGPLWAGLIKESAGWGTMGWSLSLLWASGIFPVLLWLQ